ncbi:MAG: tripartite tricarboxylate transporter substrate binding protein [Burkholderiales bacterium]|nr:tripartite tricarboxylate transporter substrate binding protein [Burkholderiales bacterium]
MHRFALPHRILAALACALACASLPAAQAQDYPMRPIRLIVPYPPGGPTDFVGRTVAQKLTEAFGQQIVVDNRPGAAAMIGHDLGAKAVPDGYTLLFATGGGMVIAPLVAPKPLYDASKDFAAISMLVISPQIIVAHPSFPASNVKELIAAAKAKPGAYNFASVGIGSPNHLGGELIKVMANVDIVHVPYKGTSPAITDLVAGQTQFMFSSMPVVLGLVKAGKLKIIATGGTKRSPAIPDVPAVAETLPGFEVVTWYGIAGPLKLPRAIVGKLNAEIVRIIAMPEVQKRFMEQGLEPQSSTPEAFLDFMKREADKWQKVAKRAGVSPQR